MIEAQKQILVIKHGALGDIILATGAMKAIRRRHPDCRITLLTCPPYDKLMAPCPFIDDILIDPKPKIWQWGKLKTLKKRLQSHQWHWVYDLQTSQRSTCYFPLLNCEYYSGLSPKGSHPHLTPERTSLHTLDRLAQQMQIAGIKDVDAPDVSWLEEPLLQEKIAKQPFIIFIPGGAPHRPEKRWPAEHYAELAKKLIERSFNIVLIGTKAEESILNEIENACLPVNTAGDAQHNAPGIINLMNKTSFAQIATLARDAHYAIGNDTGPMHLAAAAGCPSTVIFNTLESKPEKSAPRGEKVTIEQSEELSSLTPNHISEKITEL